MLPSGLDQLKVIAPNTRGEFGKPSFKFNHLAGVELLVKKSVKIWPVHGAFNHLLTQNIVWKTHTSASYRYVATDLRSQGIPTKTTNLANSY
jgi:hypothetical protein